ncbi:phosphoribosylaminoimidazolesuccinocarboxamide synthase [Bacillus piscicola]|uniref:phosphoribosylaminoimidazolesuccinocarboxamide synthase n=1 Tax=Bacillus piscicola TaxID=1632684 RepID=UPI001F0945BC|nr:phosphoribosylaminoimidazolesuccinocarboxamide synthase [Bacillus piscicola]
MKKEALLYEGKAKKLYKTDSDSLLWVEYKDEATAFNGEKKQKLSGKGRLNNEITSVLFEKLAVAGINSHFVQKLSSTEQLVQKTAIIPLEVTVRNVAAGSLVKRTGLTEGTELIKPVVEFYYKSDELGDPLLNEDHITLLELAGSNELAQIKKQTLFINDHLKSLFNSCGLILVDFKLEFGRTSTGEILLADEISPDTCRLWDKDTKEKFDKDLFRYGIGSLQEGYEEILKRLGGALHG